MNLFVLLLSITFLCYTFACTFLFVDMEIPTTGFTCTGSFYTYRTYVIASPYVLLPPPSFFLFMNMYFYCRCFCSYIIYTLLLCVVVVLVFR